MVGEQAPDGAGYAFGIVRLAEKPGHFGIEKVGDTSHRCRYDRNSRRHRFEKSTAEPFATRWPHERVGQPEIVGRLLVRHLTYEYDGVAHTELVRFGFEMPLFQAGADEHERDVGMLSSQPGHRLHESVQPVFGNETRH